MVKGLFFSQNLFLYDSFIPFLLKEVADGEFSTTPKKEFCAFCDTLFSHKTCKTFSSFILFPRTTVRLVGNAQPLISCDKLRLPR